MSKSSIHRVIFKSCKLLGVDFTESRLGNVQFENSLLNLSIFRKFKARKSNVSRNIIKEYRFL
jgi:hypothetical protein